MCGCPGFVSYDLGIRTRRASGICVLDDLTSAFPVVAPEAARASRSTLTGKAAKATRLVQ